MSSSINYITPKQFNEIFKLQNIDLSQIIPNYNPDAGFMLTSPFNLQNSNEGEFKVEPTESPTEETPKYYHRLIIIGNRRGSAKFRTDYPCQERFYYQPQFTNPTKEFPMLNRVFETLTHPSRQLLPSQKYTHATLIIMRILLITQYYAELV